MTADSTDLFGEVASLTAQINALCEQRADALLAAGRAQVEQLIARGVTDPDELERVVKDRAGQAVRVSPTRAGSQVRAARDLHSRFDHVRALFSAGLLDEYTVAAITDATRRLNAADTLVELVTGQATAEAVNVEIQVLLPIDALLDPDSPVPAELPGLGPLPVDLLATRGGRATLRRLFTSDGVTIGGETRSRGFRGSLAKRMDARDGGRCTSPYCDAPIRHRDHRFRHSHGGPTNFDNGRGRCAFHNHAREIGITRRPTSKRRS